MYDAASTILAQKISQVKGMGMVTVGGSSLPAVRVSLNPSALNKFGIGVEDVRAAIVATNANRPKGSLENGDRRWQILANDQAKTAAEYIPTIVAYRNGAPVRLADIAQVEDSVQDIRNAGLVNGKPAVMLILRREPGANVIETVDQVKKLLPLLRASIPAAMTLSLVSDRTPTIRASLRGVEHTLLISIALVVLVVFLFLRDIRAALIPSVAVSVSLIGTFGVMYMAGFSLNNISLMALTVCTGFVVDDAVVMLENISRHIENGVSPFTSCRTRGARGEFHGLINEPVFDRRIHTDYVNGRYRRATVSRICYHAIGGHSGVSACIAYCDTHDVCTAIASTLGVTARAFPSGK